MDISINQWEKVVRGIHEDQAKWAEYREEERVPPLELVVGAIGLLEIKKGAEPEKFELHGETHEDPPFHFHIFLPGDYYDRVALLCMSCAVANKMMSAAFSIHTEGLINDRGTSFAFSTDLDFSQMIEAQILKFDISSSIDSISEEEESEE